MTGPIPSPRLLPVVRARGWRVWALFVAVLALATVVLYGARGQVQQVHVVLVYLLIILGGSAYGGRALGIVLAVLGFLSIDYFFQAPFGLLSVGSGLDWFVLVTFLITAVVAANLLARAQKAAEREKRRGEEVARLSRLGAELLGAGTAEDALSAIAEKVRDAVGAERVTVFRLSLPSAEPQATLERLVARGQSQAEGMSGGTEVLPLRYAQGQDDDRQAQDDAVYAREAVARGESIAIGADGQRRPLPVAAVGSTTSAASGWAGGVEVNALFIPLRVHDRVVGVVAATGSGQLRLDEASLRLLDALSYYTAIAVERVALVAEAEHAEALRESDRVREALLASISHDLRTPLSTIKVLAQDLVERDRADTRGGEDGVATNATIIEEQADRLSRLVTNLLDLTRLRTSAFPVNPEVNAAEDLIGAAARQVTGILGDHLLERRIDQTGPVLLGKFDFVQSQRILTNLVENAVRFSPPGAPIVLGVSREDDTLAFSVTDMGPGVPASERERIFEPFYRAPATIADSGGVGLGLYIGRVLAEAQGGSLTYVSRRGGDGGTGGSTFVLRLPASEEVPSDLEADLLE